jgi:hypothetical protein
MSTLAPPNLYRMYKMLDPYLPSLRIGGVVGDTAHVKGGGYHISRDDLKRGGQGADYSIQAPADKRGPGNYASAIDLTLNPAEMKAVSSRLKAAMEGKDYDDRIEPLREFIGTIDGRNVCGWNRYQTGRRTGWYSSGYSDSSHLWHVHLSFFRDYCNDANSVAGVAEVVAGLPKGALGWKGAGATAPVATPPKPTLPTVPKPAPAETPTPPKPEEPKLTTIRVASYNILGDAAGIKGGEGPLSKRLPALIATIKSAKASVLLLQECNKEAAALVQDKLGADWVWSRVGTRTVMVDKNVWAMEEEQTVKMVGPYSKADKSFPLVKLRHLKGGDVTWFASVHLSSTSAYKAVASSAQMAEERKWQAGVVVDAFAPRDRAIGGGDLNSSSWSANKPKPVLQAGGLTLLTKDKTFDSAKVDSFPNKTAGGQQIDEIFVKGCTFLDGDIVQGKGSDHNLMVSEIALRK